MIGVLIVLATLTALCISIVVMRNAFDRNLGIVYTLLIPLFIFGWIFTLAVTPIFLTPIGETLFTGEVNVDRQYIKSLPCEELVSFYHGHIDYYGVREDMIKDLMLLKECRL